LKRLRQYGCVSSKLDMQLLGRIKEMNGLWGNYPFSDVLQVYLDLDFLLKRSFLILIRQMKHTEAYTILHEIWTSETASLYTYYEDRQLFSNAKEAVKLKDLVELCFFYAEELLKRPAHVYTDGIPPLISIILPVYRSQRYLWEALRSIYEQTYPHFELIIVNGYRNDDPLDIILSIFGDNRTIIVQESKKVLLGASLNMGIKQAQGEFIARMDADDIAHTDRLAKQIDFMQEHKDIDLCGTMFRAFGTTNQWNYAPFPLTHLELQCRSLKYCNFLHPTVIWRREKFLYEGLWYNEEVLSEDTDLFARAVFAVKTANLQESLLLYRREGRNLSIENLKKRDPNRQSLAVGQSLQLEQRNLAALHRTLNENEKHLVGYKDVEAFTYGDALQIYRSRLAREDLSNLLPSDTNNSATIFAANTHNRTPVIWGYGWNGQVLEYILQRQGFKEYKIVDQFWQKLYINSDMPNLMNIEDLDGRSDTFYILISMDKHYPEVTERLHRYGYALRQDYIEYFV